MNTSVGFFVTTPLPADGLCDQLGPTEAKREEVNLDETQTFRVLWQRSANKHIFTSVSPSHWLDYKVKNTQI